MNTIGQGAIVALVAALLTSAWTAYQSPAMAILSAVKFCQ